MLRLGSKPEEVLNVLRIEASVALTDVEVRLALLGVDHPPIAIMCSGSYSEQLSVWLRNAPKQFGHEIEPVPIRVTR